ncbi:uncharacterized protein LOC143201524 [Rhynchophorus ferrugineus]|uniref:uncharacterized protein LOC143201524 n=1 Tax=Rhynchophorus ferrugineus TaxID=354439 RepID=UPI003FCE1C0F
MVVKNCTKEIETLRCYLRLLSDETNHRQLLRDKKMILYSATLLDSDNVEVLKLCLDIFEILIDNIKNYNALISIFGVYESLEALSIRTRDSNKELHNRASLITEILRNTLPPALNTRSRTKSKQVKKQTVYLLYAPDLKKENRKKIENSLVKAEGVISFLIDTNQKKCTLRICPKVSIKDLVQIIYQKCNIKFFIVRKNKGDQNETLHDVLIDSPDRSYLEYPEDDFLNKSGAISVNPGRSYVKPGLVNKFVNFWHDSFYW